MMSATQFGGRRPMISSFILIATAFVTFNGGCWQLLRRRWKQRLMDSFDNIKKAPLGAKDLPFGETAKFQEFRKVDVEGTVDNEGTLLVGPRPMPSSRQAMESQQESRRGGFLLMSPFEVEGTGQIIMVNRGWVPVEAYKSRLQRVQFTGEGFTKMRLRGVMRQEEWLSTTFGFDHDENHGPSRIGKYWTAMRPFDMVIEYYRKRWGNDPETNARLKERHGAQHWMVEMVEDHSGDDQILLRERAYPVRRTTEDLMRPTITPAVHSMYAAFWFFVSAGCMLILRRMWADVRHQQRATKLASKAAEAMSAKRNAEAASTAEDLKAMTEAVQQGRISQLKMTTLTGASSAAAAEGKAGERQVGNVKVVQSASPYDPPKYFYAEKPAAGASPSPSSSSSSTSDAESKKSGKK